MSSFSTVMSPGQRIASPGPGERMPADEHVRQAELAAERPHLILEQFAQRLDQLHVHALGRPPTLWCDLIVTDGPPVNDTLSITSG